MCEAEPLCAENISLKDIARSRTGELISRRELIMYYSCSRRHIQIPQIQNNKLPWTAKLFTWDFFFEK